MPVIIRLFRYPEPEQKQSEEKKKSEEKTERRSIHYKEDRKSVENADLDESNALEKSSNSSE